MAGEPVELVGTDTSGSYIASYKDSSSLCTIPSEDQYGAALGPFVNK